MDFRITGLDPAPFLPLYGLSDGALAERGVIRMNVDSSPGFPDRVEMREAPLGATVLLLNHLCQPAPSPYRARHAIFVREGAETAYDAVNAVPEVMRRRLLSLRAYDADGMMRDADICEGSGIAPLIARLFADPAVDEIHAHNARRGCFAGRIRRA